MDTGQTRRRSSDRVTAARIVATQRLPWWWWAIAVVLWATFVVAVLIVVPPEAAVVLAVLTGAVMAAGLLWWSRVRVRVDADGLTADRSRLEWRYVGEIRALDPEQTRRRLGVEADATAWLLTRPWLPEAVEIEVIDAADPHPYWLVGCADSLKLATALQAARPTAMGSDSPTEDR